MNRVAAVCLCAAIVAITSCSRDTRSSDPSSSGLAHNVVIITIDTLRADRVGAYGYARASTPALDGIAKNGVRFDRAFSAAPITQTSHATLLTGRYPQGHGARHNGIRINDSVPTLAEKFRAAGFATGAFVAAFPLDRRFGLSRGFDTYSDAMPRDAAGRPTNEKPGRAVVDEAIAWLGSTGGKRIFLWVHLFEPHAPYGSPSDPSIAGLGTSDRYDREVAEADAQVGRLLTALGTRRKDTLIVATSDHGEAFGEHGEIGHSMFVYDTTLRVPLMVEGPGIAGGAVIKDDVGLVDVAGLAVKRASLGTFDSDGMDLSRQFLEPRDPNVAVAKVQTTYYAESFAPLLDFGWSPLRSVRAGFKYIEAPRPELYEPERDPNELTNLAQSNPARLAEARTLLARAGGAASGAFSGGSDPDGRLSALGYIGASPSSRGRTATQRADPKDKIKVASSIARITSGEAQGQELEQALRAVLAEDPRNPQMNLRLGYVLAGTNRCPEARKRFTLAIEGQAPTADAHLGLAGCQAAAREFDAAIGTLREAAAREPGNPIVAANLGLVLSEAGRPAAAIEPLQRALAADPSLHQARFGLALALARANRRPEAVSAATELLRLLPPGAPQRPEVERLLRALSSQ